MYVKYDVSDYLGPFGSTEARVYFWSKVKGILEFLCLKHKKICNKIIDIVLLGINNLETIFFFQFLGGRGKTSALDSVI